MSIAEAIRKAVKSADANLAGQIVEQLRTQFRMNYDQCLSVFKKYADIDRDQFESLMYESEEGN